MASPHSYYHPLPNPSTSASTACGNVTTRPPMRTKIQISEIVRKGGRFFASWGSGLPLGPPPHPVGGLNVVEQGADAGVTDPIVKLRDALCARDSLWT